MAKPELTAVQRQSCKNCGRRDKFNFHVSDEVWEAVAPAHLRNLVICLPCFDAFAAAKRVEYAHALGEVYFAGDGATFEFHAVVATPALEEATDAE